MRDCARPTPRPNRPRNRSPAVIRGETRFRSSPTPPRSPSPCFFPGWHVAGRIRESLIHIFEPASEAEEKGLDELHKQTVAVLAFHKVKTDVFDSQLAFNLLARYGEKPWSR